MEILTETHLLLALAALVAGAVDAVVGGGGMICIPALLMSGLPPHVALATNKFQSCFGTSMALFHYHRKGYFKLKKVYFGIFATAMGAILGVITVMQIASDFLNSFIMIALLIIFVWLVLNPKLGMAESKPKMSPKLFLLLAGLSIGFYDGFFGPGTGSFWMVSLMFFYGLDIKQASGHTKVFNLTSNIVSVIVFFCFDQVHLQIGIIMASMQILGGHIGAQILIYGRYQLIRKLFLGMMLLMILKFIFRF